LCNKRITIQDIRTITTEKFKTPKKKRAQVRRGERKKKRRQMSIPGSRRDRLKVLVRVSTSSMHRGQTIVVLWPMSPRNGPVLVPCLRVVVQRGKVKSTKGGGGLRGH
jgi:hypothetical protein